MAASTDLSRLAVLEASLVTVVSGPQLLKAAKDKKVFARYTQEKTLQAYPQASDFWAARPCYATGPLSTFVLVTHSVAHKAGFKTVV